MAHNDANNASPSAPARAKTARVVAVVALVLTALVWAAGATFYLLMSDGSGAPASLRLTP